MPRSNNKEYCKVFTTVRLQTRCFGILALMGNIPYSPLLFPVPWLLPIWSGLLPWAYLGHFPGSRSLNGLKCTIRLNWMETDLKSKSTPRHFLCLCTWLLLPTTSTNHMWDPSECWPGCGLRLVCHQLTQTQQQLLITIVIVFNNNCNCFYGPKIKLTDLHL